jgi:hypothetical protein
VINQRLSKITLVLDVINQTLNKITLAYLA